MSLRRAPQSHPAARQRHEPNGGSRRWRTLSALTAVVLGVVLLVQPGLRPGSAVGQTASEASAVETPSASPFRSPAASSDGAVAETPPVTEETDPSSVEATPTPSPRAAPAEPASVEPTGAGSSEPAATPGAESGPRTSESSHAIATSTATPTPEARAAATALENPLPNTAPLDGQMSTDEAIDLIWKGEYDKAERALQGHLRSGENGNSRAELLVYLAYIASIRQEQAEARTLLQSALEASPGIALSPVEFPKAMRDMLTDLRSELFAQKPRPARGALEAKSVLSPEATPLAWKSGGSKWYRKWYVWAGVAAVVAVAVVALDGDPGTNPSTATPTVSPTPTATATAFEFNDSSTTTLSCARSETIHTFQLPTPRPGARIVVNSATVGLELQGDYDGDEDQEVARLRIEENPPILSNNFFGQYCATVSRQILTQSEPRLQPQLQEALQFDGTVTIKVRDGEGANEHCDRNCSPFHRVFVDINYSIVVP